MKGGFLPPQVIYQGKTAKCLPSVMFPNDGHITCTINHWTNEVTTKDYINKILLPYIDKKRKALGKESPALVIFDRFKGQLYCRYWRRIIFGSLLYLQIVLTDYSP